mgnify:CR=1 FL=1
MERPLQLSLPRLQWSFALFATFFLDYCFPGVIDLYGTTTGFLHFDREGSPGRTHDTTNARWNGITSYLTSRNLFVLADRLYDSDAARRDHILAPYKKKPNQPSASFSLPMWDSHTTVAGLTSRQTYWNTLVRKRRALVENAFGRLKNSFPILRLRWRGQLATHRKLPFVLASITNMELRTRPLRCREPYWSMTLSL